MTPQDVIDLISAEFPGTTGTWSKRNDYDSDTSGFKVEINNLDDGELIRYLDFSVEHYGNGSFENLTIIHHLKSVSARLSQESECEFESAPNEFIGIESLAWIPITGFGLLDSSTFYSPHGVYAPTVTFEKQVGLSAIELSYFVEGSLSLDIITADSSRMSIAAEWTSEKKPGINLRVKDEEIDGLKEAA